MALQIPCPKCGAELKLRDSSLLGKTGKCPKCGHRFVLADPNEKAPPPEPAAENAPSAITKPSPAVAVSEVARVLPPAPSPAVSAAPSLGFPVFADVASPPSSVEVLKVSRRGPPRGTQIALGAVLAAVAVGLGWVLLDAARKEPTAESTKREPPKQNAAVLSERKRAEQMASLIASDSPTKGEPITLRYVPAGASVVVHLHPAALWKSGTTPEETRFCLGDQFVAWSEEQIKKYCLFPPDEIEEATLCLILGSRGTEPQVAAVVRLAEPVKRSKLIELFGAELPKAGESVYVGEERAFAFGKEEDAQKRPLAFASVPANLADDLAAALDGPGLPAEEIRKVLEKTDRSRHLTIAFRPSELRIHEESLVRPDLRGLWNTALDRFGGDVEAAAWSLHFAKGNVVSEFVLRNEPVMTPTRLEAAVRKSVDAIPEELLAAVSKMNPSAAGSRKVIGRSPAMAQVFAASTVAGIGERFVVLQTRLPERAAPNLALAGLLAWDESTRTDFTAPAPDARSSDAPTGTLAERLKKSIEIDFRRTPLEEAFAYVGGETGVEFEIDGDALKLAGYTRNMPQTFNLGRTPAEKAITEMLKPPQDKLAVVLDEAGGKAIVTSKAAAEEKGLTPATFSP